MKFRPYHIGLVIIWSLLAGCSSSRSYKNAFVSIEKTPCFGACPIFKMSVNGEGEAKYKGERFVSKLGEYEKTLTEEQTQKLFKIVDDIDWDRTETHYPTRATDLPSTILTVQMGVTEKNVVISGEHPEYLDVLDSALTRIANSSDWVNVSTE